MKQWPKGLAERSRKEILKSHYPKKDNREQQVRLAVGYTWLILQGLQGTVTGTELTNILAAVFFSLILALMKCRADTKQSYWDFATNRDALKK